MAIWYAQTGSRNISDWSAGASTVWFTAKTGGTAMTGSSFAAVLGASDILVANAQTGLAIDADYTCAWLQNSATGNGASGNAAGQFTVTTASSARTITASILAQDSGTATTCLAATLHATNRLTIGGSVQGGAVASSVALSTATTGGLLTITGNVIGGSAANAYAISAPANSLNLTVNGETKGGTNGTAYALNIAATLTATLANVTADVARAVQDASSTSSTISISGAVTASSTVAGTSSPAIFTLGTVTMASGSSIISNSTSFYWPINGRIKWESSDTGKTITLYDASGGSHVLKVPQYPAAANVWHGTGTYDYGTYTPAMDGADVPITGGIGGATVTAGDLRYGTALDPDGANILGTVNEPPAPTTGTLTGCVDSSGVNQGNTGILASGTFYSAGVLDSGGTRHAYGVCDSTQAWSATGIIHDSGTLSSTGIVVHTETPAVYEYHATGILAAQDAYYASGILNTSNSYAASGVFAGTSSTIYSTTGLLVSQVLDGVTWHDGDGSHTGTHTEPAGGYTYGDEDPSQVLTTAAGAGTLDLSLYTLISRIVFPATSDTRTSVVYGIDTNNDGFINADDNPYKYVGTLKGIVDYNGTLHSRGVFHASIYDPEGIIDTNGNYRSYGILSVNNDNTTTAIATGIVYGQGEWQPRGIYDTEGYYYSTGLSEDLVTAGINWRDSTGLRTGSAPMAGADDVRSGVVNGPYTGNMIVPSASVLLLGEHAGWYHAPGKDPEAWEVTGTVRTGGYPDSDRVDGGTVYGASGERTGTGMTPAEVSALISGTGARRVTFTVTDGADPIMGVSVRLFRTGSTDRVNTTDASGQVTFLCDVDATWSWTVTHPLYDGDSGTVTVDGNEAVEVALTSVVIGVPSDPANSVGVIKLHANDTTDGKFVSIWVAQSSRREATGHGDSKAWRELVSDVNGLVQAEFVKGLTYVAKRGRDGTTAEFVVPDDADSFFLPSILGEP